MGNEPAARGEIGCRGGDSDMDEEAEELLEDATEVLRSNGEVPLKSERINVDCAER